MTINLIWNWPVCALSYERWRFAPREDVRRWLARVRLGPVEVEVTRWR